MTKKVVICVGIPASGKTTYAEEYLLRNEGTVILERDQIREVVQPGYYLQKPNKNVERQVTGIANNLLKKFLKNKTINTIIISDTNLNTKTLKRLNKDIGNSAEVEIKTFEDSLNLDLCLERNRNREKKVPDEVVIKFWKSYMSQYGPDKLFDHIKEDLLFIGDIHSQYDKLVELLKHHEPSNYHYVFLGDINDSRMSPSKVEGVSFLKTYKLIRDLVESNKATLIHSNHHKNLISAIRGRRKKAGWGLGVTLDELEDNNLISVEYEEGRDTIKHLKPTQEVIDIANWLDSRPYYFEKDGIVGVHAQFLKEHCQGPYDVSGKGKEALVYGTTIPRTENVLDNRIHWWEEYEDNEVFVVAGHYHVMYHSKYARIIDAGCGQEGGKLAAYIPTTNSLTLF